MLDQATKRRAMVDNQLRTYDITQQSVLTAMERVAREAFVPEKLKQIAYADRAVAFTGLDRFMLSPMLLAKLLQSAQILPDDRILDVGCGSGYSAVVLSIHSVLYSIESVPLSMFPTFMYVHSTLGTHISCTLYRHTVCVYYSAIRAGAGFG